MDLAGVRPGTQQNTTYKDLDRRVHYQCYADDLTFILQFPKSIRIRKEYVEALVQEYLDVCDRWSKRWGLFFNPDKCEWAIIGNKRSNVNFHLTLYGKELKRTKYLKVLGLVIEGDKKDPFNRMEDIMKKRFRLITRQLKTFIIEGTFHETKTLYHTIMISRSLYASQAWSTATHNVDMYGRIGKTYHKDRTGQCNFQQPLHCPRNKIR